MRQTRVRALREIMHTLAIPITKANMRVAKHDYLQMLSAKPERAKRNRKPVGKREQARRRGDYAPHWSEKR